MAQVLDKAERRSCRDEALRGLNVLASELQIGTVALRASPADVQEFFKQLCLKAEPQHMAALRENRDKWLQHGGADLPDSQLTPSNRDGRHSRSRHCAAKGCTPRHMEEHCECNTRTAPRDSHIQARKTRADNSMRLPQHTDREDARTDADASKNGTLT